MALRGKAFPNFILPLRRETQEQDGENGAYEFYFLQWSFHPPPTPIASTILDPTPATPTPASNIPISTILLTPLLEYKTRQSFATPHLILTHHTDLARSHHLVLLRGELTPTPSAGGNYWLSQADAQLLALGVQRFYLTEAKAGDDEKTKRGKSQRAELLRIFNEEPERFNWEDLLQHVDPTAP